MNHLKLKDIEQREPVPGYKGRLVHGENMTIAYFDVEAGAIAPEHSHPHEQVFNLMEGSFELTVHGEARIFSPGEVMIIPSNLPHAGKAITACKVIDVFCPVREDFR